MDRPFVVELTPKMLDKLDRLERAYRRPPVRVVSYAYGLPVLLFPSGKRGILLTSGEIEWIKVSPATG